MQTLSRIKITFLVLALIFLAYASACVWFMRYAQDNITWDALNLTFWGVMIAALASIGTFALLVWAERDVHVWLNCELEEFEEDLRGELETELESE